MPLLDDRISRISLGWPNLSVTVFVQACYTPGSEDEATAARTDRFSVNQLPGSAAKAGSCCHDHGQATVSRSRSNALVPLHLPLRATSTPAGHQRRDYQSQSLDPESAPRIVR